MSLIRLLLLAVVAYLVIRMVRIFSNFKRGTGSDDAFESPRGETPGSKSHIDFPQENIKDAEFIDLTPPEKPPEPPKAS
jgi:hypothetical protein